MEFLHSNFPPITKKITNCRSFVDAFESLLSRSTEIDIAVGYVTADSLVELQQFVALNQNIKHLILTIGMQYIEHFTKLEYNAAQTLNEYLKNSQKGEVRLVHAFKYHGKLYSYSNENGPFAGIIGSNNLSSIIDGGTRVYESAVLLDDQKSAVEMHDFIQKLNQKATKNISELNINQFNTRNHIMENQGGVTRASENEKRECFMAKTNVSFEIPIKPYENSPRSNLNACFGKGRVGKNGLVKPRHWYEIELIVPKSITSQPGYPKAETDSAEFTVITDDGWKFKCKVSGDYSKNFRSEGDLKILGRWLKGRMENEGVLKVGEKVTQETLDKYKRNSFTLTKTKIPGVWYLDFSTEENR